MMATPYGGGPEKNLLRANNVTVLRHAILFMNEKKFCLFSFSKEKNIFTILNVSTYEKLFH